MMSRRTLQTLLILTALMSTGPASDTVVAAQAARIDSISPAAARPDERVTITGNGFGGRNVRITVGDAPAQVVATSGNSAVFIVPRGATIGATKITAMNPGGQQQSIAFRVLLGFALNAAAAQTAVIGPEGGVVTAQSDGTTYTLDIPPAALDQDVAITLTPIGSIANLPFSNGIAAGAHFAPSGLQLLRTAMLTIDRPSGGFPAELLGFLVDDDGVALEVLGLAHGATQLVLPVDHFTAGGAGAPSLSDFENQVRPLLDALPPSLPSNQVRTLIAVLAGWLNQFGFTVCAQTDLCARVFDVSIQSLALNGTQFCTQAATLIQQGEPFLARTALQAFVKVAVNLLEISELANQVNVPGFDQPFDITCAVNTLHDIVDLAEQQALANPRGGLLLLLSDISADAALLDEAALQAYALTTLKNVMDTIATRAEQTCPLNPVGGEALLDVVLDNFLDTFLDALDPGYAQPLHDARAGCRIQIVPAAATVDFDQQQPFSAITNSLSPAGVTWSIEGSGLATTIDSQTGLFTAAQLAGNVTIKATSVADPTRFKRAVVTIRKLILITITPATAVLNGGTTALFTAQVQGAGPLVTWGATGGIITGGPSATATFTAGFTPGTFSVSAMSVDDPTVVKTVSITIIPASNATRLTGTLTLVAHWDEAIPTFREVVNVSMSATATVNMAVQNGRQFIPNMPATATGTVTGDAIQIHGCGTEHDTFTGGTIVLAVAFLHGPFATADFRLQFFANGTNNISLPESCGVSFVNPRTNLLSLYSVSLRLDGTVLRSSDGTTILEVDFNRTFSIDVVDGACCGGTVTVTGRLQPVP